MPLIAVVQGFKVSVADFDKFLAENQLPTTEGYRLYPHESSPISELFERRGVRCKVRVFIPARTGFNNSRHLYICCDWIPVYASRELQPELWKPVPSSFRQIQEILSPSSHVSTFVIHDEEDFFTWTLEKLQHTAPVSCGICPEAFESWFDRMDHRRRVHEIIEDQNPLPDC